MKAQSEFLLEIGCEEIPARMIAHATAELKVILEKHLTLANLAQGSKIEVLGGPRRLAASLTGLRRQQPDSVREVSGPPKSVAYDSTGRPSRAAESFASKQGVSLDDLYVLSTPRGDYVAAKHVERGRSAREILTEIIPRAIREIPWPRGMYWTGASGLRFIRPIRWIVASLDGQALKFELDGLRPGKNSAGHRFLGRSRVSVTGPVDYTRRLRANFVLVQPAERRHKIEKEIREWTSRRGLRVHRDEELLGLVTYMNEYPTVVAGSFDAGFLDLPAEILVTVMRDHQKYFAVETPIGELAPHFLAVINLDRDRNGTVRAGHERVLRARFTDARFFWETDQKCRLADYLPRLAQVTYESRLGSYLDKVERVRWLARWLAEQWFNSGLPQASVAAADRAAELAKCDLVTEMVREFTELQGVVGGLYAKAQGEPEEVAWAVYDHYKPLGLDDPIPRNLAGCAVAIADKLDALAGCFTVGLIPSGSSDPFALRRAALGVVKIILERKLPLSLSATLAAAGKALGTHAPKIRVSAAVEKQVMEFLLERVRYILKERLGFAYDEVNAALAAGADDLVDAERRLEALKSIRRTKNFEPLAVSFKRIRKILEKAGPASGWRASGVKSELMREEAEKRLHRAANEVARKAGELKRTGKYREALHEIAELRPAVDRFFNEVLVMAPEEEVRKNRLTLLAELLGEFSTIADFSELAAGESR